MQKKLLTNAYVLGLTVLVEEALVLMSPVHFVALISKVSALPLLSHVSSFLIFFEVVLAMLLIFLLYKTAEVLVRIVRSRRWDVIISILAGTSVLWLFDGIRYQETYDAYEELITTNLSLVYTYLPALVILITVTVLSIALVLYWPKIKQLVRLVPQKKPPSSSQTLLHSLSDDPWVSGKPDLLNYQPLAKTFSKKVLEGVSEASIVFGLEAPWGAGKTSFLQMCRLEWEQTEAPLIINFNPWHFDTETDLVKKYFDQLRAVISRHYFSPELDRTISKYVSLISSLGFDWISLKLPQKTEDIKDTHDEIGRLLKELDLKIIVIIDDLDRIHLDKAKQILKLVALCADFPNIRYILCYDLENLYSSDTYTTIDRTRGAIIVPSEQTYRRSSDGAADPENVNLRTLQQIDNSPLQSYLEKIVNTKYILPYYQRNLVLEYLVDSLYEAFFVFDESKGYVPEIVPISKQKLRDDLISFFDEHPYIARRFLFSLRQVKSVVKTFLSAQENNPRLFTYDIGNIEHLILFIVIKYHYPKVYSDICFYEYARRDRFSLGKPKYHFTRPHAIGNDKTIPGYREYAADHGLDDTIRGILSLLFEPSERAFYNSKETIDTYHLSQHIKFIEGIDDGTLTNNLFIEFFKNLSVQAGANVLEKFMSYISKIIPGLDSSTVESAIKKAFIVSEFFSKLMTKVYEVNRVDDKISIALVKELVSHFPKFSVYESENVPDTRDHLFYAVLKVLNDGVWNKKGEGHNTVENVKVIANYLLKHSDELSVPEKIGRGRGAIGIYELAHLRYSCNMSRSGNLWELNRALRWHKLTKNGTVEGVTDSEINQTNDEETLEEISLHAFSIFKEEYIDQKRNFLAEVEGLTPELLLGTEVASNEKWLEQIKKEERFEERVGLEKAKIQMFTIYDLCFDGDYSGIKCGGYLYDGRKIKSIMQDYLFDTCFTDAANQDKTYEYFVNILLRGFENFHSFQERGYKFVFEKFKSFLDTDRLLTYWSEHRDKIKAIYAEKEGVFYAGGYVVFYKDDARSLSDLNNKNKTGAFDILDIELEKRDTAAASATVKVMSDQ